MGLRNSIIYLAKNIKLDKDYRTVLKYSETNMINLVTNQNNLVYSSNDYSFIRDTGTIQVKASYSTVCQANYMAFQNQDYSNKWFFAFIDEIVYKGDLCTEIRYTIDVWSTWYSYWSPQACFVVREHVTNDSVGLHTVPENLELGDFISCWLQPSFSDLGDTCFVVATTEQVTSSYSLSQVSIPMGLYYYGFTSEQGVLDFIKLQDQQGRGNVVNSVFIALKSFFDSWSTMSGVDGEISASISFEYTTQAVISHVDYLADKYYPHNNKLLCYPYSFLQVSNNSGQVMNYRWENFNILTEASDNDYKFQIVATITPGGSGKAYPVNYNNIINDYDDSIMLGKLPVGSFTNDVYTNWLTQNGVNIALDLTGSAFQVAGGFANLSTGSTGSILGGTSSIVSSLNQVFHPEFMPNSVRGNVNAGDVNFVMALHRLTFKRMSIKREYAKIIDDYFTRQGYKVNTIKVPNMSRRENYNFVQIGNDDNVAVANNHNNICPPASDLNEINNLFRRGVTIWNNHNNLGNYSVSNNITN